METRSQQIAKVLGIVGFFITILLIIMHNCSMQREASLKDGRIEKLQDQLHDQGEEIQQYVVEVQKLQKYIEENSKIPEPGVFDVQGISKDVADRYYLVYVQLILLAEAANAPEGNLKWLRDLVRKGVLHNVLQRYSLIAIDQNITPPQIAAQISIDINWEDCELHTELKSKNESATKNIHDQPTMSLAYAFSTIVKRENLKVEMRCHTVDKPNFEALNTLGVPAYEIGVDTTMTIKNDEFRELVFEELNLVDAEKLYWREGDEKTITVVSTVTPELSVQLKYIQPKKQDYARLKN